MTRAHWFLIATLSMLTFVLGTSEFVIVGILNEIAGSLNITIPKAGTLVSGFALSFAIGTPIVMSLTGRLQKRKLMLGLISLFIVLNLLSALSGGYALLLATRLMTAIVTGVLISLAMLVASESVPLSKRGVAVSFIFGGFTMANVFGVPLGTLIGQTAGWQSTFLLTTALGAVAFAGVYRVVPYGLSSGSSSLKDQLMLLAHPRILIAFFIPALGFGATYAVFTYLVPILSGKIGLADEWISPALFLYGIVSIFSNLLAGKIASRNAIGRLRFVFLIQGIVLAALYFSSRDFTFGLINIALMSLMAILLTTSTQLYLIDLADKFNPDAKGLAASLMPVASNVGIAFGSALGGFVVANGPLMNVAWVGGLVAFAAAALTAISYRLDRK